MTVGSGPPASLIVGIAGRLATSLSSPPLFAATSTNAGDDTEHDDERGEQRDERQPLVGPQAARGSREAREHRCAAA